MTDLDVLFPNLIDSIADYRISFLFQKNYLFLFLTLSCSNSVTSSDKFISTFQTVPFIESEKDS